METSQGDLREGKGHQGPTDHYEVENVPEVTEVGTLVQDKPQVDHLGEKKRCLDPLPCPGEQPTFQPLSPAGGTVGDAQQPEAGAGGGD